MASYAPRIHPVSALTLKGYQLFEYRPFPVPRYSTPLAGVYAAIARDGRQADAGRPVFRDLPRSSRIQQIGKA